MTNLFLEQKINTLRAGERLCPGESLVCPPREEMNLGKCCLVAFGVADKQ